MELQTLWRALRRRWYMALVGLLLAASATFLVVGEVGPSYRAQGTVLLFPPSTTLQRAEEVVTEGNPYLYLGGLTAARDVVLRTMGSQTTRSEIEAIAPGTDYELTPDIDSSGPIVMVTATGPTEALVLEALDTLLRKVPETLVELQSDLDISNAAFITSKLLTQDAQPEVVRKQQIRAGIVVAAGVLALSLLLVALVDGLLRSRPRGTRPAAPVGPAAEARDQGADDGKGQVPRAARESPGRSVVPSSTAAARAVAPSPATDH